MVPAKGKYGTVSKGKGVAGAGGGKSGSSAFSTAAAAKVKDIKKENSTSDAEESEDEDAKNVTDFRPLDHTKNMPRFMSILGRLEENPITMEDLDTLQMELELLLNSVVLRGLNLQRDGAAMAEKPSKPAQTFLKGPMSPGKRSKQDERSPKKFKDSQAKACDALTPPIVKSTKLKSTPKPGTGDIMEELLPVETTRSTSIKNDTPNKFWSSVEPYCASFTDEDLKLVDDLIAAHHDDDEYLKIPPLGRHYTLRWAEDDLHQEQRESSRFGEKKKSTSSSVSATEDTQRMLELAPKNSVDHGPSLCGPLTQRLISALMEENIVTSLQDTMHDCDGQDENTSKPASSSKSTMTSTQAAALERRIRQELEEQGILAADETHLNQADDEILTELRRCQGELKAISQFNLQQLKKLHRMAQEEMKRQEVRKRLSAADAEVLDIYRKMASAKQKKRPITKKEKDLAWKALRDREAIVKQLDTAN